jgi:hypothetical protein
MLALVATTWPLDRALDCRASFAMNIERGFRWIWAIGTG